MKGWGAQDDFQQQIAQTEADGVAAARAALDTIPTDKCVECGEDIPIKRKRALPNCNTCVKCQMGLETLFGKVS